MMDLQARRQGTAKALATLRSIWAAGWDEWNAQTAALGIEPAAPGQFWTPNLGAVLFWREFVRQGGICLDPSVWHDGAAVALAAAIERALVNGWSSPRAGADFIYSGAASELLRLDYYGEMPDGEAVSDALDALFHREISRALLATQVTQQIADLAELLALDAE